MTSSFGANRAAGATDLSAAAVLPTVTVETLTAAASAIGGGAPVSGAGAAGSAGAVAAGAALLSVDSSFFLQPTRATPPSRAAIRAVWSGVVLIIRGSSQGIVGRRSIAGLLRRQLQGLAREDLVRVIEHIAVGFEDLLPGISVAQVLLGDLRQRISLLHGVGAAADNLGGAVHRSADAGEVRLRHLLGGTVDAGTDAGEIGFLLGTHPQLPSA
ncbi:hypothetical protein G6F63_014386 [Rhizopus arrhizus]|nr:hypothetical protein G6F63_014386 [Rhizopus arrhizus]